MRLAVDEQGHIQLPCGRTTSPLTRRMCYVGTEINFIGFDSLLLPDDRVAIHSMLSLESDGTVEDFLYEVVERHKAWDAANSMLLDAAEYLQERGFLLDDNDTPMIFLSKLWQELQAGLH